MEASNTAGEEVRSVGGMAAGTSGHPGSDTPGTKRKREEEKEMKVRKAWENHQTVFTNGKAGMVGYDKDHVQKIVYEMSKVLLLHTSTRIE